MAIKIKPIADIAEKYSRVTPMREADFKAGVSDTTVDWETPTTAAAESWADGVQSAITNGSFSRGVAESGTAKWRRKVTGPGVARWGAGVRDGAVDYKDGYAPYRDIVAGLTLSPRYKRGDPRNYVRSQEVGMPQHDKKVSG